MRYLSFQLPAATGLTQDEIRCLIEFERFPQARCHPVFGPSWNRKKIDAWSWGLKNNVEFANSVELILGRGGDNWANSGTTLQTPHDVNIWPDLCVTDLTPEESRIRVDYANSLERED